MASLTKKEKERKTILYLYKYRYLLITHFQKLFNQKEPKSLRKFLKGLEKKKYIAIVKENKDPTKPHVYCLDQGARNVLKNEEDIDENFLNWLYKEKKKSEAFIQRNLFLVDCRMYFWKNKEKGSKLSFFTKQDLAGYDYLPDPLPDAYIDVEDKKGNTRYFLDYFTANTPPGPYRFRIRYYLKYAEEGSWQANTDNAPFPAILFVCPTETRRKFVNFYAGAKLRKSYSDIEIFLTTKDNILFASKGADIWQKVE